MSILYCKFYKKIKGRFNPFELFSKVNAKEQHFIWNSSKKCVVPWHIKLQMCYEATLSPNEF
jgi:hypothetical protein